MTAKKSKKPSLKFSNRGPQSRLSYLFGFLFKLILIIFMIAVIYKSPLLTDFKKTIKHKPPAAKIVKPDTQQKPETFLPAPVKKQTISTKPKLIFIIDDMGTTKKYKEELESLRGDVTYAILPQCPYSEHFAKLSLKTKAETIVHLPLESEKNNNPGPGLITTRMSYSQIVDMLEANLKSVPYHKGMNNHMGSKGTADKRLMRIILEKTRERGLFFLDSRTTTSSVIIKIARDMKVPAIKRDVFLDNAADPKLIRKQIEVLTQIAKKNGHAVGIGHYKLNTLKVLNEEIPRLKSQGFKIISLSEFFRK